MYKQFVLKIVGAIILVTIKIEDFGFHNILFNETSYENISTYDILYKILIDAEPLRFRVHKVEELITEKILYMVPGCVTDTNFKLFSKLG